MKNDYITKAQAIIEKVTSQTAVSYLSNELLKEYIVFCANLYNFLPEISSDAFEDFYRSVLLNQSLAGLEQSYPELIYDVDILGETMGEYKSTIFCSFHFASYRLVNLYLVQQNISFDLVVATKPFEEQGATFYQINHYAKRLYGTNANFRILNAETKSGFMEALKTLKSGGNLLFYIDGNTGVGSNKDSSNLVEIDFLKSTLMSRTGIAFLSYHTNSRIIPVIAKRNQQFKHSISFYDEIIPNTDLCKEINVRYITQSIFKTFQSHIKENYQHWECWLYLEKFVNHNRESDYILAEIDKPLTYNKARYGVTNFADNFFLFDRFRYSFIPTSSAFYDAFLKDELLFPKSIISKLIEKNILINI